MKNLAKIEDLGNLTVRAVPSGEKY